MKRVGKGFLAPLQKGFFQVAGVGIRGPKVPFPPVLLKKSLSFVGTCIAWQDIILAFKTMSWQVFFWEFPVLRDMSLHEMSCSGFPRGFVCWCSALVFCDVCLCCLSLLVLSVGCFVAVFCLGVLCWIAELALFFCVGFLSWLFVLVFRVGFVVLLFVLDLRVCFWCCCFYYFGMWVDL